MGHRKAPFACEVAAIAEDQARQRSERNGGGQKIRDVPGEPASEANQTKCPESAHTASVVRIPLPPAPLDADQDPDCKRSRQGRPEEHTYELQSPMRI